MNKHIVAHVPLGELTERVSTWTPSRHPDEDFFYLDLSSIDQTTKEITGTSTQIGETAPSRARQLISTSDVLVSTVRPNLNGVAIVGMEHDGATASTGFCVLRPDKRKLDARYLFHWVRSPVFVDKMVREATGASYPAVSDRIIKTSEILLPPLDEQRRIAAILDKADALRRKRKHALDLLDGLTQSIFLEMFGDPVTNPKGLKTVPLGEIATFTSGGTPSKSEEGYWGGDFPWVSPKDMKRLQIADTQDHLTGRVFSEKILRRIPPCSVLIVIRGMILAHTVPIAITARVVAINQDMKAIAFASLVHPIFGLWNLRSMHGHILSKVSSAAHGTKRLSMDDVENLPIFLPGSVQQERFVNAANKVALLSNSGSRSGEEIEKAFASLQSRAFTGAL